MLLLGVLWMKSGREVGAGHRSLIKDEFLIRLLIASSPKSKESRAASEPFVWKGDSRKRASELFHRNLYIETRTKTVPGKLFPSEPSLISSAKVI
jgi:hypothetical protein